MRLIRHPLVSRDIIALVDHIVDVTQSDFAAGARRLDEIDAQLGTLRPTRNRARGCTGRFRVGWFVMADTGTA
ncbi:hypothetical protein [Albidovulum sp.]|uniref:hypothetical protein n=1 Tax=Albidovulum sp. TaxID=1872424 RepID=UPI0039B8ADBE